MEIPLFTRFQTHPWWVNIPLLARFQKYPKWLVVWDFWIINSMFSGWWWNDSNCVGICWCTSEEASWILWKLFLETTVIIWWWIFWCIHILLSSLPNNLPYGGNHYWTVWITCFVWKLGKTTSNNICRQLLEQRMDFVDGQSHELFLALIKRHLQE